MIDHHDRIYMARALQLAERGLYTTDPNPRVGCVIVRDGRILGEGWHMRAGAAHAELNALDQAGSDASGSTLYVTLEPCSHHGRTPPCADRLIQAGIRRVVAAMTDPNPLVAGKGFERLREHGIEVEVGTYQAQAEAMNPGFVMRMRRRRPFVRCKLAMTLDGRTATAAGESKWITSSAARADVQRLRARSSAVMTGIGTVFCDDPALTVRSEDLGTPIRPEILRQPLRVVVDTGLRIPENARVLDGGNTVVVCAAPPDERLQRISRKAGVEIAVVAGREKGVDLSAVLAFLAERQVNEVLLEAGPTLSGAMMSAGLVDELVLYVAPRLLGDAGLGLFRLPGLDRLVQAIDLDICDVRAVGQDLRVRARPTASVQ